MDLCLPKIIELTDLTKSYGKRQILKGVSLSVNQGEFVSVMGSSGAGKSTLINIVGLLDEMNGGSYFFEGEDITKMHEEARVSLRNRKIGFIFQAYHLINSLSVMDNILLPAAYAKNKVDKEYFDEMVGNLGLREILYKRAALLSGGEKQRASIARALINKPSLLIADEPTGNLDEQNTGLVADIFSDLCKKGTAILMVTHDSKMARLAQKQLLLSEGLLWEDVK